MIKKCQIHRHRYHKKTIFVHRTIQQIKVHSTFCSLGTQKWSIFQLSNLEINPKKRAGQPWWEKSKHSCRATRHICEKSDFLNALQVNSKQLPKQFLNLVEILAPPQFLLVESNARQTGSEIPNRWVYEKLPRIRIKPDNDPLKQINWKINSEYNFWQEERFCGCCRKPLREGPKTCLLLWCHFCCWVHFKCSGFQSKSDYHLLFLYKVFEKYSFGIK